MSERANAVEPAQKRSSDEHNGKVRTPAHWLRKAIRARISASRYPEDRHALENVAEMYELMAERMAQFNTHPKTNRPPYRGGVGRRP